MKIKRMERWRKTKGGLRGELEMRFLRSPTQSRPASSRPKHHLGQNKHQMPPSTQEISDGRKEQQTKSAENI